MLGQAIDSLQSNHQSSIPAESPVNYSVSKENGLAGRKSNGDRSVPLPRVPALLETPFNIEDLYDCVEQESEILVSRPKDFRLLTSDKSSRF